MRSIRPFADIRAVEIEGDVPTFSVAPAVVGEFHSQLMLAGRDGFTGADDRLVDPEKVVTKGWLAVLQALVFVRRRSRLLGLTRRTARPTAVSASSSRISTGTS